MFFDKGSRIESNKRMNITIIESVFYYSYHFNKFIIFING